MKRFWLGLGILGVTGCMVSNGLQYQAESETNIYHLARVRKGMSQRQVLCIMHKPYSYETFEVEDDIYDVWFYVTRPTGLDQTRMVPQNLTPLTFKNGALVGTGYPYYYYAMKEQANEMAAQAPRVEKAPSHQAEDKEFEKTLRSIPQERTPAAPPKTAPEKEKLPPNVHIISQSEVEGCALEKPCAEQGAPTCEPCQSPCGPCPTTECGPDRFSALTIGMTEMQVFHVFGQPLKHETFSLCEDVYDVWHYDTIPSKTGKPSNIPQHQTILTFKNAVLISMDDEKFFELKKMQEAQVAKDEKLSLPPREPKKWPSIFKPYQHQGAPLGVISEKEFSHLKKGMTEDQVMKKIGVTDDQDTFMIGNDTYNVWFYKVNSKQGSETVPLTFKNGRLIGTTAKEYGEIKAGTCDDCYDEKGERLQEDADEQNFNYW